MQLRIEPRNALKENTARMELPHSGSRRSYTDLTTYEIPDINFTEHIPSRTKNSKKGDQKSGRLMTLNPRNFAQEMIHTTRDLILPL